MSIACKTQNFKDAESFFRYNPAATRDHVIVGFSLDHPKVVGAANLLLAEHGADRRVELGDDDLWFIIHRDAVAARILANINAAGDSQWVNDRDGDDQFQAFVTLNDARRQIVACLYDLSGYVPCIRIGAYEIVLLESLIRIASGD